MIHISIKMVKYYYSKILGNRKHSNLGMNSSELVLMTANIPQAVFKKIVREAVR